MARKRRKAGKPIGGWQIFYGLCVIVYAIYLFSYGYDWTEARLASHENSSVSDMLSEYVGCTVVNLSIVLLALISRRGRLLTAMLFLQTALIFVTAYAARMDIEGWLSSSHARSWWDLHPLGTSDVFLWCGAILMVVSALLAPVLMGMKRTPKPRYSYQWTSSGVPEPLAVFDEPDSPEDTIYEEAAEEPEPAADEPVFEGDLADEPA
ncbi:MAG TPA: hypothetical protein VG839_00950 [Asticcacaulis sp.]|nr:hypothetical protein [Asticcacaulis sp.]